METRTTTPVTTVMALLEEKLRQQLPEQKRVWQSLGILGGAFLVVILI